MKILLIAIFSLTLTLETPAQTRTTQTTGTDGERIEEALKSVVNSCFGDYAKYTPNFFPDVFRETKYKKLLSRKSEESRLIEGVKFELLARSVFSDISNLNAQINGNIGRTSPIDIKLPDAIPLNDASSLIFAFTCTTALKLALEQDFKFNASLPGTASAGIKQALQAQSDLNNKNSLALMYGIFKSPISLALESTDLTLKSRASASIWSYYLTPDGKTQLKQNPKYLKSIRGWMLSRASSRDLSLMVSSSANANAGIYGFEANLGSTAKISSDSSFLSSDFTIILDEVLNESLDLENLPNPTQLSDSIAKAAQHFPKETVPFLTGKPIHFNSTLRGVPSWLCNSDWSVTTTPNTEAGPVYYTVDKTTNECQIYFDSVAIDDIRSLDVILKNESYPIINKDGNQEKVEIKYSYKLRAQPTPLPIRSGEPTIIIQQDQINPTFNVSIAFEVMPSDPISFVSIQQSPTISCDALSPTPTLYPSRRPLLPANSQYSANMAIAFAEAGFTQANCNIKLPVSLKYKDSDTEIIRELGPIPVHFTKPSDKK